MANITLTNLPVVTSLTGSEPLLGVQSSTSVQITVGQIATYANAQSNITQIGTGRVLANISGSTAYPTGVTVSDLLDNTISNVAGSVMYRSLSTWTALPPGILGQALTTNGPLASPQWRDFSGGGTVLQITAGTNLSATPANPITSSGTINTVMNPAFTTSVTTPLVIGGTTASSTLTLQSTSGVGTSDSILFKVGNNGATTAMTIDTAGRVGIGANPTTFKLTVVGNPIQLSGGTTSQEGIRIQRASGYASITGINNDNNAFNPIAFFTGASEAMRIDTSGNVGIGTTSPSGIVRLHAVNSTDTARIRVTCTTLSALTGVDFQQTSDGTGYILNRDAASLAFSTNNTERMRIDSSGNVGIGVTPSGSYKLQVNGQINATSASITGANSGAIYVQDSNTAFNPQIQFIGTNRTFQLGTGNSASGFNNQFFIYDGTAAATRMIIDSSGNVGVGTSSPGYKLDVQASQATMQLKSTTSTNYTLFTLQSAGYNYLGVESSTGGSLFTGTSAYEAVFGTVSAYPVGFATNNTERMRIDSSGNVGIGTTSPGSLLHIQSSAPSLRVQETSANNVRGLFSAASTGVYVTTDYSSTGIPIIFGMGGVGAAATERMRIDANGNVSIGPSGTSAFVDFLTNSNITGGTSAYAHYNNGVVQSGVTTLASAYVSNISLTTAAFTTGSVPHFWANPGAGGAGSTITNQYGFFADSTVGTQGAATVTNAYGFYGNLASGTNRWNLYMGGTAPNYMAGNLGIGSAALTSINLRVSSNITGATNAYAVYADGIIQSGVTSSAAAYTSTIASAAAAFTTTSVSHFFASPNVGGAGSTITNHIGFNVAGELGTQGAATVTNAYGFYGGIASATNRYNIYMAGTANNYFTGYSFGLGGVMARTSSTATNTVTLTATQVASGFIIGTPTATASYTLPTAAALDTELSNSPTGTNFELVVFTTAAFAITILTNTGWTLVGSMATGATANSFARFRANKTGAGAWSLYRIS